MLSRRHHSTIFIISMFMLLLLKDLLAKSPSSQYGLMAQEDIDPRGIRVTNGPMR
jgi:hypothetical protein